MKCHAKAALLNAKALLPMICFVLLRRQIGLAMQEVSHFSY